MNDYKPHYEDQEPSPEEQDEEIQEYNRQYLLERKAFDEQHGEGAYDRMQAEEENLIRRSEQACGRSFTMGPANDPYGVECIKDAEYHRDLDNGDAHVGYSPFDMGTGKRSYIRWEGGGYVEGDPLPKRSLEVDVYFDEDAYFEYVDYRREVENQ